MTQRFWLLMVALFLLSFQSFTQVKEFDRMEMYYTQGHYKSVLRQANHLLDQPDYDYSLLPKYYKGLALFQLVQNERYLKRRPHLLQEARSLLVEVFSSQDGMKIINSHMYEVSALKLDLGSWLDDLQRAGNQKQFDLATAAMKGLFDRVPDVDHGKEVKASDVVAELDEAENKEIRNQRELILKNAKKQIGVPYRYAGNDPKGFDCSGFVSYVMKMNEQELPRRASEQFSDSKKLKKKNVQQGDLVFFDSGSGVNHVGIIVSGKGEPLTMIHSSTSKGIVITNIETTDYWSKRVAGFGTFIK
ncbi:MAG: C40 family peptidase [Crocinitomicaceae bacterium]|nr:C40 family peptidase [Crocinitomicaceae bacterium]